MLKECEARSIIGPFKENPFGGLATFSPLDTRKKRDSQNLRVILNLSHPFKGGSVNHSIDKSEFFGESMALKYPSVDSLAKIIRDKSKSGQRIFIFKQDLKKAYRQMKMQPGSIFLLGYVVNGLMYFDVTLSMGSKSAAYRCQHTTDAVIYIFEQEGYQGLNYLDDLGSAEG